jgi:hypothetical protein
LVFGFQLFPTLTLSNNGFFGLRGCSLGASIPPTASSAIRGAGEDDTTHLEAKLFKGFLGICLVGTPQSFRGLTCPNGANTI